jgi:hypothetical protein
VLPERRGRQHPLSIHALGRITGVAEARAVRSRPAMDPRLADAVASIGVAPDSIQGAQNG